MKRKIIRIDESKCDGCGLCASACAEGAIKIIDGNKPALCAATVEVLDQLGWLDDAQRKQLEPWRARLLRNARGLKVGERLPVFRMQIP